MSVPLLPQNDPASDQRMITLQKKRKDYAWTFDKYPYLPMLAKVPKSEVAPKAWSDVVNGAFKTALANNIRSNKDLGSLRGIADRVGELAESLGDLFDDHSFRELSNDLLSLILAGNVTGRASSIEDFSQFFQTIPLPAVASKYATDAYFSRKAVCGANPESLARVSALSDRVPVTDAMLQQVSPGDRLDAALAEGRLFTADYGMLQGLEPNAVHGPKRYVYAPTVLYVVPPGQGTPAAFAIQVGRTPGADNPVFTPADGWGWTLAKTHASVADTIAGALWFHHARTHIVAEPFVVSAHRQLAPNHPLLRLLLPHFEGTLYINELGWKTVFAPDGLLDWFTGATRPSLRDMVVRSAQEFRFEDSILPRRFAARGVDDASVLSDFPYRDDALLVYGAIHDWVEAYIGVYYPDDGAILADLELQGWLAEVTAPDAGGIQGLGEQGRFRTRAYLVDVLSQLLYAGSALHAAMNFPVSSEMAFVPNSPFGAYTTRPTRKDGWTEADFLALLPPLDAAQRQFDTAYLLGESRFGKIGAYTEGWFSDPRVTPHVDRFKANLADIELTIDERNARRPAYIHLKPSRIPPGINI
ncbi:MAG: lipoxygenase [Alphaproteobacteria bacterium]|nr:lipoxygenase [Alphaproteobacteria bacterium]